MVPDRGQTAGHRFQAVSGGHSRTANYLLKADFPQNAEVTISCVPVPRLQAGSPSLGPFACLIRDPPPDCIQTSGSQIRPGRQASPRPVLFQPAHLARMLLSWRLLHHEAPRRAAPLLRTGAHTVLTAMKGAIHLSAGLPPHLCLDLYTLTDWPSHEPSCSLAAMIKELCMSTPLRSSSNPSAGASLDTSSNWSPQKRREHTKHRWE
jgi:hypothetical protein